MEQTSTTTITKKTQNKAFPIFVCFAVIVVSFFAIFFLSNPNQETHKNPINQQPSTVNSIIKTTCSSTFYPSLCFSPLFNSSSNTTTIPRLLETPTVSTVSSTQPEITAFFGEKVLNLQEKNALNDCIEILDLAVSSPFFRFRFENLKTLLGAAMTNENTCIDGFSVLAGILDSKNSQIKGLKFYLEMKLNPIIQMISNSLAIVKHMEETMKQESGGNHHQLVVLHTSVRRGGFPTWMSKRERKMMGRRNYRIKANAVVAKDGSGSYKTVGEAVKMAPNMSYSRYVIRIKAGVYKENLEIPRNKMNIMLFGDGINSTLITGNRSIVNGFSTFTSATLTVIGDRFLARDLTIENTASPEMYQAVAIRVTSNSAFFRCNFTSNQDTLYAHSLRQFYRECVVQGTIDFIFGNAAAIFHNCHILARKPIPGKSNMLTAQGREDPNQNTGFSLHNCTIEAAPDFSVTDRRRTLTFLGRPWRNYSRTIVMMSYLGELIHPLGWSPWDEYSNLDTVEYIEYMNFGPGADTRNRVRWRGYNKNCSENVAKRFTVGAFLQGHSIIIILIGLYFAVVMGHHDEQETSQRSQRSCQNGSVAQNGAHPQPNQQIGQIVNPPNNGLLVVQENGNNGVLPPQAEEVHVSVYLDNGLGFVHDQDLVLVGDIRITPCYTWRSFFRRIYVLNPPPLPRVQNINRFTVWPGRFAVLDRINQVDAFDPELTDWIDAKYRISRVRLVHNDPDEV